MNVYLDAGHDVSFGTFPLRGDTLASAMRLAAEIGYRSFDTAQMYGNEREVGACLASLGLPREELLITTKVSPNNFAPEDFLPSVEQSLRDLQLDQVDVLLLHWPDQYGQNAVALEQLQKAHDLGYAAHIGLSNYTIAMMEDAMARLSVRPVANQVEFHPFLNTEKLLAGAQRLGLPLTAYCAVARGKMATSPLLDDIGRPHGKSGTQVGLRWTLQKGVAINAMSTKAENLRLNFELQDFQLDDDEMRRIDGLMAEDFRIVNSDLVPSAPDWD